MKYVIEEELKADGSVRFNLYSIEGRFLFKKKKFMGTSPTLKGLEDAVEKIKQLSLKNRIVSTKVIKQIYA